MTFIDKDNRFGKLVFLITGLASNRGNCYRDYKEIKCYLYNT